MSGGNHRRWAAARAGLRHAAARTLALTQSAVADFFAHRGALHAAAIAFFLVLSIFPLAIVGTSIAGFVASDQQARGDVVDFFLSNLPLAAQGGRRDLDQALRSVTDNAGTLGVIGLLGILISASAVIGAVRNSLNVVWEVETPRPPLVGKLFDLLLAAAAGLLVAASLAATLLRGALGEAGAVGEAVAAFLNATSVLVPILLAASLFTVVLRVIPAAHTPFRDIWPGIIVATAGYELTKEGFAAYVDHLGRYDVVYGSLGAVIVFMVFVYLASIAFLIGAEFAASWPKVRDRQPIGNGQQPVRDQITGYLRSLIKGG